MYSRVFIKSTIRAFVSAHLSAVNGGQQGSMGCNHGYGLSQEGIRNHLNPILLVFHGNSISYFRNVLFLDLAYRFTTGSHGCRVFRLCTMQIACGASCRSHDVDYWSAVIS